MNNLLQQNERRKLRLAEILVRKGSWVKLNELAEELECSERILKYDIKTFKDNLTDFTIESSHRGIRLLFKQNKGFKNIYENIYKTSYPFQLLELLFFDETLSIDEIAERFFISPSTLYRVIHHTNKVISKYDFQIETNPCKIIGNEENIRWFYYQFFFEKYNVLSCPYEDYNRKLIEDLLYFFISSTNQPSDFAYYHIAQLILFINLSRYKKGHFIKNSLDALDAETLFINNKISTQDIEYFKKEFNLTIDSHFVHEVMSPFLQNGYFFSYDHLMKIAKIDEKIAKEVQAIEKMILDIAQENNLSVSNKEKLILELCNVIHLENFDPQAGYILYNRNQLFKEGAQQYFPCFYQSIHEKILSFRKQQGLKKNERLINYMIYVLFVEWENLLIELQKNKHKIQVLVISNRTSAHSWMLKDFLDTEFNGYIITQVYDDTIVSLEILENLDFDLIVTNFPLPDLHTKKILYIENFPTKNDVQEIQRIINQVDQTDD